MSSFVKKNTVPNAKPKTKGRYELQKTNIALICSTTQLSTSNINQRSNSVEYK